MIVVALLIAFISGIIVHIMYERMQYIRVERTDKGDIWIRR